MIPPPSISSFPNSSSSFSHSFPPTFSVCFFSSPLLYFICSILLAFLSLALPLGSLLSTLPCSPPPSFIPLSLLPSSLSLCALSWRLVVLYGVFNQWHVFFRWCSPTRDFLTTSSTSATKIQSFKWINCGFRGNGWLAVTTACGVLLAAVRTGQRLVSSKSVILTHGWEGLVYQLHRLNKSEFLSSAATKNHFLVKRSKESIYQLATHQMSLIN